MRYFVKAWALAYLTSHFFFVESSAQTQNLSVVSPETFYDREIQDAGVNCLVTASVKCNVKETGLNCYDINDQPGDCGPTEVDVEFEYCNKNEDRGIELLDWRKTQAKILTKNIPGLDRSTMRAGQCRNFLAVRTVDTCLRGFTASLKVEGWLSNSDKRDGDYCYAYDFMRVIYPRPTLAPSPSPNDVDFEVLCRAEDDENIGSGVFDTKCDEILYSDGGGTNTRQLVSSELQPFESRELQVSCDRPLQYTYDITNNLDENLEVADILVTDGNGEVKNIVGGDELIIIGVGETYTASQIVDVDFCELSGQTLERRATAIVKGVETRTNYIVESFYRFTVPVTVLKLALEQTGRCIIDDGDYEDETVTLCQDYIDNRTPDEPCIVDVIYEFVLENVGEVCDDITSIAAVDLTTNELTTIDPLGFLSEEEAYFCPEDIIIIPKNVAQLDLCEIAGQEIGTFLQINGGGEDKEGTTYITLIEPNELTTAPTATPVINAFKLALEQTGRCIIDDGDYEDETVTLCQDYIDSRTPDEPCIVDAIFEFVLENVGEVCGDITSITATDLATDEFNIIDPLYFLSEEEVYFCPEEVIIIPDNKAQLDLCELAGQEISTFVQINGGGEDKEGTAIITLIEPNQLTVVPTSVPTASPTVTPGKGSPTQSPTGTFALALEQTGRCIIDDGDYEDETVTLCLDYIDSRTPVEPCLVDVIYEFVLENVGEVCGDITTITATDLTTDELTIIDPSDFLSEQEAYFCPEDTVVIPNTDPTSAPTVSPTVTPGNPTVTPGNPASIPTTSPTVVPGNPTSLPTSNPTVTPGTPTVGPTSTPTAPVASPTSLPTTSPTSFPTTIAPTTSMPTTIPVTFAPTRTPTMSPETCDPSDRIRCTGYMSKLVLQYNARRCNESDNEQSRWQSIIHSLRAKRRLKGKGGKGSQMHDESPVCVDYCEIDDMDPFVIIESADGYEEYLRREITEGEILEITNGTNNIGSQIRVKIYNNEGKTFRLMQEFKIDTSCSSYERLAKCDMYGSMKVVGYVSKYQGAVGVCH